MASRNIPAEKMGDRFASFLLDFRSLEAVMQRLILLILGLILISASAQAQEPGPSREPAQCFLQLAPGLFDGRVAALRAVFPDYAVLQSEPRWSALYAVLQVSQIDEQTYVSLPDLQKAALFNLFAKMQAQVVGAGQKVFDFVERITEIRDARLFVIVRQELLELLRDSSQSFRPAPDVLHVFPSGWTRMGSFKTCECVGNLELTFARNSEGVLLVDADIDLHQGAAHATDVMKHMVTGADIHPYHIGRVLLLQGIDPGYGFAEKAKRPARAA